MILFKDIGVGGLVVKSCPTLATPCIVPTRLLCPWDSPGHITGEGCNFFLQGIFPTQGLNLRFLQCRQILYQVNNQGSLLKNWDSVYSY